jgi:hypothetical protein
MPATLKTIPCVDVVTKQGLRKHREFTDTDAAQAYVDQIRCHKNDKGEITKPAEVQSFVQFHKEAS